jgi:hypothetical protein
MVIQPDHDGDDADELRTLINQNHLFGSTIVGFPTVERSIAAIKKLASRWSKCSCSYVDHGTAMAIHCIAARMMPTFASNDPRLSGVVFAGVVRNFCRLFENAVTKVKPFSIANGRHPEIWPATSTSIIPHGKQPRKIRGYRNLTAPTGPETTIKSRVTWSRFLGSARAFSLFIHICGPVIVPAIVRSRSAHNYMVEHGLQICSDISNASLKGR